MKIIVYRSIINCSTPYGQSCTRIQLILYANKKHIHNFLKGFPLKIYSKLNYFVLLLVPIKLHIYYFAIYRRPKQQPKISTNVVVLS